MGLLPKLDFDILATVNEFLTLLREMDAKLGALLDIETDREARIAKERGCRECNEAGRLRCTRHGPVKVPAEDMHPDLPLDEIAHINGRAR